MIDAASLFRRLLCAVPVLLLAGCMPQETVQTESPAISLPPPPQRSYLDPGPVPATGGGPNYTRPGVGGFTRQTDAFGNGVLPQ